MRKTILIQFYILLLGTIFAWLNLTREFYFYFNNKPCDLGCSIGNEVINPIFTPCFYGALFFAAALSLSVILLKKSKEEKAKVKQN